MNAKKAVAIVSVIIILASGVFGVFYAYTNISDTYDGSNVDVTEILDDPEMYVDTNGNVETGEESDGVADIIVKENLSNTMAANNVAAIVFDFRGFDTLGESFILLTAIAGSYVILSRTKKKKKEEKGDEV